MVPELAGLLQASGCSVEVTGHCVSTLATILRHQPTAVELCQDPQLSLREALERSKVTLGGSEYQVIPPQSGEFIENKINVILSYLQGSSYTIYHSVHGIRVVMINACLNETISS